MENLPQILKSRRIFLQPLRDQNLELLTNLYTNEQIYRFLNIRKEKLERDSVGNIFNSLFKVSNNKWQKIVLSIFHKSGKQFLGACGLSRLEEEIEIAETFYALLSQYWGNGYMIEAMKTLFRFAFNKLELHKIVAYIPPGNTRAWKVAERSGMKYMGQVCREKLKFMFFTFSLKEFKAQIYY